MMEARYQNCCPQCGMKREEFDEKREFGCANCFEVFAWEARTLLLDTQGCAVYKGMSDAEQDDAFSEKEELGKIYDKEDSEMFGDQAARAEEEERDEQNAGAETADIQFAEGEGSSESGSPESDRSMPDVVKFLDITTAIEKAVAKEDYEEAARLRDALRKLSSKPEKNDTDEETER